MPVWRIFSPSLPPRPLKPAPSVPHRPQKGLAQSFPSSGEEEKELARLGQAEREPVAVAATRAPDPQHAARPELPLPLPKRNFGPGR